MFLILTIVIYRKLRYKTERGLSLFPGCKERLVRKTLVIFSLNNNDNNNNNNDQCCLFL